jgi:hypothetical protein
MKMIITYSCNFRNITNSYPKSGLICGSPSAVVEADQ